MNASDLKGLKLGNLVMLNSEIVKVDNITSECGINMPNDRFECNMADIEPIPLTDVWLLKCGGDVRAFATGILIDRFRFIWKEVYSYWYVLDAHNQTYLTKIEFVHELQNFYFAMNGQELNITG